MKNKFGKYVGVIVGHYKGDWRTLRLAVPYKEFDYRPKIGEFLVVEEENRDTGEIRKILTRVEEETYFDYKINENDRVEALILAKLREIGTQRHIELFEDEKDTLLMLSYKLAVLGELKDNSVNTVFRSLPLLTSKARYPEEDEYKIIVSAEILNNQGFSNSKNLVSIGYFCVGDEEYEDIEVHFDVNKFVEVSDEGKVQGRRTAIFGRAGYGKSNTTKIIASIITAKSPASLIIFDMNGEYAFPTRSEDGLLDHPDIRDRIIVYTDARRHSIYKDKYPGRVFLSGLNLKEIEPYELRELIQLIRGDLPKKIKHVIEALEGDESKRKKWKEMIDDCTKSNVDKHERIENFLMDINEKIFAKSIKDEKTKEVIGREPKDLPSFYNLLNAIYELIKFHSETTHPLRDIKYWLYLGYTIILDFGATEPTKALAISTRILKDIYSYNVKRYNENKKIRPIIACFEEAQNILSKEKSSDETNIFVKWAKEGRKYGLGMIYITQQPGSIEEKIVSQTDNFFVTHLLNEEDINALKKCNRFYGGVVSDFLQREALIGVTYVYSSPYQPYVFPVKFHRFSKNWTELRPSEASKFYNIEEIKRVLIEEIRKYSDEQLNKGINIIKFSFILASEFPSHLNVSRLPGDGRKSIDDLGFLEFLVKECFKDYIKSGPTWEDNALKVSFDPSVKYQW